MAATKTTFGTKLMIAFSFLCLAVGAFNCTKTIIGKDETQTETQSNPQIETSGDKISSEQFCGNEFKSEDYQKEMDMQKKYSTILNCDGTYKSELNWNAYSPSGEETYNETVGVSEGNFKSFTGSWEIITDGIPDYITRQINEYEDFEANHMPKNQTTVIKYQSNDGRSGYAYIYKSSDKGELILTPVPSAFESTSNYKEDDLHMYFGRF